jgi:catechol 2,3-dioxygenase-like lactoylglutathione lyase family enzyme
MKLKDRIGMLYVAGVIVFAVTGGTLVAQLPGLNEAGVGNGHVHMNVPDAQAAREMWLTLGAMPGPEGGIPMLQVPGMYLLFTEREPSAPSTDTVVNHIGFSVQSYPDIHAKLEQVGATFGVDNAETGQILADLPGGMRVEMQQEDGLANPIEFHHIHMSVPDQAALRDWYMEAFGAEAGERRGMPSAVFPGGRIDYLGARGGPPTASRGTAIDHIGFEVADMDAFVEHMEDMGVALDVAPRSIGDLTIAFVTDPVGTYIEITEGLGQ